MNKWTLAGKLALVTGGSKGIGLAIVEEFVHLGAEVIIVARNDREFSGVVQMLQQRGFQVTGLAGDVSDRAFRNNLISHIASQWGKLDILVNNVGTNLRKKFIEYTAPEPKSKIRYFKSFGKSDLESSTEMKNDYIFRIASQTKAITSLAVMMLIEEGKS